MSRFITFEGPEGCGKTTQARRLAALLEARGQPVCLTREPGGTPIAEQVRAILLRPENHAMLPAAELLLYLAARAQHTAEVIRPALRAGVTVLCDRYSDSTLAYQGFGHGLPLAEVEQMDSFATGHLRPDLTIYLDVPVAVGLARKRGAEWNRLEAQTVAFHERVRAGYHTLIERAPARFLVLDGQRPEADLAAEIAATVVPA
ncbi:MAG: dTMP kinase [Chloroflexi bacterium]|nr:dTMP kinase [Chloroflexota bacterium]